MDGHLWRWGKCHPGTRLGAIATTLWVVECVVLGVVRNKLVLVLAGSG